MPQSKRRRRAPSTDKCFVTQVAGLDYTEPSVEVAVSPSDDKSQPTVMLYAGTSPGLQDLLAAEMGGSSTTITKVRDCNCPGMRLCVCVSVCVCVTDRSYC